MRLLNCRFTYEYARSRLVPPDILLQQMLQVIGYCRGPNTFVGFIPFLYVCVFYSNQKSNIQEGIQLRSRTPTPEDVLTKGFKAMSTATS